MCGKINHWKEEVNGKRIRGLERQRKWCGGNIKTVEKNYPEVKTMDLKIKRTTQVLCTVHEARFPSRKVNEKFLDVGSTEKS